MAGEPEKGSVTRDMVWRDGRVGRQRRPTLTPSRHPPSPAARSLDALHRASVTMIILDDSEDPFSDPDKLIADSRSVHRPATPTPSLPSYEISQSQAQAVQCPPEELEAQTHRQEPDQQQPEKAARKCWPKNAHRRFRRALLYALVVYFVITVAVGVPIIVVVCGRP